MKKMVFTLLLASSSGLSFGGCVGAVVMGKCQGTQVDGVNEEPAGYRSNSGAQYQYNLNTPSGQRNYGYDYEAQRRDQMSADPRRETDRQSGQYGGGIYR